MEGPCVLFILPIQKQHLKNFVRIHQKNLQVLATEIFKAKLNIPQEILKELFSFNIRN